MRRTSVRLEGRRRRRAAADLAWRDRLAREVAGAAEFAYQRDHEMAVFPADHLLRRTRLGLFYPRLLQAPDPQRG